MDRKLAALEDDGAYLGDIAIALRQFEDPLTPSGLLVVAQLFAARLVVRLRGESYAEDDLIVLTLEGRVKMALARARLRVAPEKRCGDLLAIHRVLRRRGQADRDLLDEIRDRAFAVENDRERAYAFAALGEEAALSGFPVPARAAFDKAADALALMGPSLLDRIWVLQVLAGTQARAGFYPDALAALRAIHHPFYLAWTAADMAPLAPESGARARLLTQAESLAARLEDPGQEIWVLKRILLSSISMGADTEVRRLLRKLRELAATSGGDRAIQALAIGFAAMGRCQKAGNALQDLREGWARGEALKAIAVAWGKGAHWYRAERTVDTIEKPVDRRATLRQLAVLAAEEGAFREARHLLKKARMEVSDGTIPPSRRLSLSAGLQNDASAPPEQDRLQASASEAVRLAESGNEVAARNLLRQLETTVPITTFSEASVWQTLAIAHARLGERERAFEILQDLAQIRRLPVLDNLNRREEARKAARAAAECGAFLLAFEMLEELPSDLFSGELALCAGAFERLSPGLAATVKTEVARILGWSSSPGEIPERSP
ncbi:MAG TPA: hypothetical protein VKM72_06660 [Thermoanaerobaculia bacterium]|nr:hypothetical protein [Thermoanaerobaculia bacterium]